jgi:hypothetical protein
MRLWCSYKGVCLQIRAQRRIATGLALIADLWIDASARLCELRRVDGDAVGFDERTCCAPSFEHCKEEVRTAGARTDTQWYARFSEIDSLGLVQSRCSGCHRVLDDGG